MDKVKRQEQREREEDYRFAVVHGDDPDVDVVQKKKKRRQARKDELSDLKYDLEMDEHKLSMDELVTRLQTDLHMGLTQEKVNEILSRDGPNQLSTPRNNPAWVKFCKHMFGGFALLLWIGSLLSYTSYSVTNHVWEQPPQDNLYLAVVLMAVAVVTACFSYYQETKTETLMNSLTDLLPQYVTVVRSGERLRLHAEELVVGDVIHLQAGDRLAADVRITSANDFLVDTIALTGDSEPQQLTPTMASEHPMEARNIAFLNYYCVQGTARGVVIQTGDRTLYGRIANLAIGFLNNTPVSMQFRYFIRIICVTGVSLGVMFAIMAIILGYTWVDAVFFMVGVSLATVPEGLTAMLTISLALTAKRAAAKNCLLRSLEAVENLSATSCVLTNLNGVLTHPECRVQHAWYDNLMIDASDLHNHPDFDRTAPTWTALARVAVLCNDAQLRPLPSNAREAEGGPVDRALLQHVEQTNPGVDDFRRLNNTVCNIPFNTNSKFQVSIHEVQEERGTRYLLVMKGAPELILDRCSTILVQGQECPLNDEWRDAVGNAELELATYGERVLGFCDYALPEDEYPAGYVFDPDSENFPLMGLRFIGLMSLSEMVRASVPESVMRCRQAGIKVVMVTGEHPATAKTLARHVGIISQDSETIEDLAARRGVPVTEVNPREAKAIVVQGEELREMTTIQLDEILLHYSEIVFARTFPQQKLLIVEACQRLSHVVAVTGDSVNDTPALRTADLAVGMGLAGNDLSKQSSDMILLDDNFSSIVTGIEEGRLIYDNLKKSIVYTLASNIPEIAPFILFLLANVPLPLGTITVICIDFGTDLLPSISLAYEQAESDLMKRPPHDPHSDSLVNHRLVGMAYGQIGMIQAIGGFYIYFVVMAENGFWPERLLGLRDVWDSNACNDLTDSYGQEWAYSQRKVLEYTTHSAFFVAVVIMQWADLVACKTRRNSIFNQGMMNHHLTFSLFFETGLAIFLVYCPGLDRGLRMYPILFVWFFPPMAWSLVIMLYEEIRKMMIRKKPGGWLEAETYY